MLPTVWLVVCTLSAGWLKLFSADPKIGFLAHAAKFRDAIASGTVLPPAKSLEDMQRVLHNDYVDAALCRRDPAVTTQETPYAAA